MEAQEAALTAFATSKGLGFLAGYTEIESGKRKDRPELTKAIAHAKRSKATLVVAKLDRLARNVAFLSAMMESGVEFVACDNPHANRLTLHILAAIAEHEAAMISERTKAALQAARARGVKLGSSRPGHWDGREEARRRGATNGTRVASEHAHDAYTDLLPIIQEGRSQGATLRTIANELNTMGHTTRRGRPWNPSQVLRVLRMLKEYDSDNVSPALRHSRASYVQTVGR